MCGGYKQSTQGSNGPESSGTEKRSKAVRTEKGRGGFLEGVDEGVALAAPRARQRRQRTGVGEQGWGTRGSSCRCSIFTETMDWHAGQCEQGWGVRQKKSGLGGVPIAVAGVGNTWKRGPRMDAEKAKKSRGRQLPQNATNGPCDSGLRQRGADIKWHIGPPPVFPAGVWCRGIVLWDASVEPAVGAPCVLACVA